MAINLELKQEQIDALVAASIMQTITPEKRDELLKQAIAHLISPRDTYDKKSEITRCFEQAVSTSARKFIEEQLKDNADFNAKVSALFNDTVARVFESDREKLLDKLADGFASWLSRDSSRY